MTDPVFRIIPTFPGIAGPGREEFERRVAHLLELLAPINQLGSSGFCADGLVTLGRNLSFLEDERFMSAVQRQAIEAIEASIIWRTHLLCWAAGTCLSLPGDLVECGTYRGYSAAVLADYHRLQDRPERRFYLYDTFNPSGAPGEGHRVPHHSEGLFAEVQARFARWPNVVPVRGRIPEVLAQTCPERICFLHIDLNAAAAERAALEALYDRVVPRGVILFDDFGWQTWRASRDAVRDFMAARGQMVAELPTGQGLAIKS